MPELSVDEAQRLTRQFLTGQAGEAEIQRLQSALSEDQGAALELLAQMQTALDDSAPAGLNAEQDRSVNSRIEALIAPRVKKRGPFAFILKLFKRKPKVEEEAPSKSRRRRGRGEQEATPAPEAVAPIVETAAVATALDDTLPGGDTMEEMAPIAAPSSAPAPSSVEAVPAKAAAEPKPKKPLPKWLVPGIGALVVLALIAYGVFWFLERPPTVKPVVAVPVVVEVPTPMPTASPTPQGRGRRGIAVGVGSNEALPAEIPATTPIPAGSWPQ